MSYRRDEIGRMARPVMRIFRAFQVALVIACAALALKWWELAGLMAPLVLALVVWLWVEAERDVQGEGWRRPSGLIPRTIRTMLRR